VQIELKCDGDGTNPILISHCRGPLFDVIAEGFRLGILARGKGYNRRIKLETNFKRLVKVSIDFMFYVIARGPQNVP